MPQTNELLESREQFFRDGVTLKTHRVFCGDERLALLDETYLHVFGGVANAAYNSEVLARSIEGLDRSPTFIDATKNASQLLNSGEQQVGVHSDVDSEHSETMASEGDDPIGCGYIKLRQKISAGIAIDPDKIVAEAETLFPELFTDPSDTSFAHAAVRAHAELANDAAFFGDSSRAIASAAVNEGAPTMLVKGKHVADKGIINDQEGTTIDSNDAMEAGLAAYVQDFWASRQLLKQIPKVQNLDARQRDIATLIDTIGTMWALGVTDIAVRS